MSKKNLHLRLSLLIFISFLIFLLSNQIVFSDTQSNIIINEVMYNPTQDDNYNEWIELYNPTNQSINISDWSITDNNAEDFLEGDIDNGNGKTTIPPNGYAIIADHETKIYENFSIPNTAIRIYVDDLSIGNGLGNSEDRLILKDKMGNIVDSIEWGYDYPDIPGMPADTVNEGHTLARYEDTNNSMNDFYEEVNPTPGEVNGFGSGLNIDFYPQYIPKIKDDSTYSIPFAIKINISNYLHNETYQLKAYVVGNYSNIYPATQTWDDESWQYSYYYTFNVTTDENGSWSKWICLRFNKDYLEYQNNIERNNVGYLKVKIKNENYSNEISKEINLLDLDDSTSNGINGGYAIGRAVLNNTFLENKLVFVENKNSTITGIYFTENNSIDDLFVSEQGYYKIASPVGTNYTIKFCEENLNVLYIISNVTIEHGEYGVDISSSKDYYLLKRSKTLDISLTVKNTGDFQDTINLNLFYVTNGWHATLEKEKTTLEPGEKSKVNLHIVPCQERSCRDGIVKISAVSEKDIGESDTLTMQFDILAPDLTITNIKFYGENDTEGNEFGEGNVIRIKAFLKNVGNDIAKDVDVDFYYDVIDDKHFIGSDFYDSVEKYQKYPSVKWDTHGLTVGDHTVYVIVGSEKHIDEFDETNNELSAKIRLFNTFPSIEFRDVFITEVYYHTHPGIKDEFVKIYNPANRTLDISGWYITNEPKKNRGKQIKIIFPDNTTINSKTCLLMTQNASDFFWETGKKPDFEYDADSMVDVKQMFSLKDFVLSNKGESIALKDPYNHTIDVVVYGEFNYNLSEWNGSSIKSSGVGVILKRNFINGSPVDTNTSDDWVQKRRYGIGQSDFQFDSINFYGELKTFVSPDSSYETIVDEIRKANKSIYLNMYEFTNPFLCDELISALKRNISVHIFLEGGPVGGMDDREKYIINRIAENGGYIRLIVNDPENDVYARYTFDHAKYLVIDKFTVIVESCNWAKTGVPKDPTFGNREWGVLIRNSSVASSFLKVFIDDWNPLRCDSYSFDKINLSIPPSFYMDETIYKGIYEPQFQSNVFYGNFSVTPVFSPDNSEQAICGMIDSANYSIYVEQLYVYKDWDEKTSPFAERLVNKSKQGVDVKVIMNYNPFYEDTVEKCEVTKQFFEANGIEVKFVYTNWSYFTNVHNKGMIVDNKSVLISSINWNENSVTRNRESGIIVENEDVANYYSEVFFYDWNLTKPEKRISEQKAVDGNRNTIYTVAVFTMTFAVIARDWRKRQWK